jgi:proteasome activator subunit 4
MVVFRLWYGLNSGLWDDQASDLMGQLAIAHVDPGRSDPSLVDKVPREQFNTAEQEAKNPNHVRLARGHQARLLDVAGDIVEDEDGVNYWSNPDHLPEEPRLADPNWTGIRKDIGIFTEQEFEFLMSKCLRSLSESSKSASMQNQCSDMQMFPSEAAWHRRTLCR